jgi:5'-nucleotidase
MRHSLRLVLAAVMLVMALDAAASRARSQAAPVDLRILAINDFHGYLQPPPGGIRIADPGDKTNKIAVEAGGAEHMATLVRQLRQGARNSIFVAAGDLIGASPFLSALFHDEPTIESLSMMGLEAASVGNHECDEGKEELLRMQNGGCHPTDGCQGPHPFTGARFRYLAASTIEKSTGTTVFPPYAIREFEGIPVAFIGLTLKGTPDIVSPVSVAGLEFKDEADTVNALVPELRARGVEAIVVLIHQGGFPAGDYNECPEISGPIVDIVKKFDRAVDVVISGHTHQAYVCEIDGRLVTSGDKYGTLVTAIDLKLDPVTHDVISAKADNVIVRTGAYARDPEQTALIESYDRVAAPIANRPAGSITETLSRTPNDAGESALGDIVADAQLAATRADKDGGAVIAFTNPGGVRDSVSEKGRERGDLRRCLFQPAVPEPAGHADADGSADQGRARAAMARSEAAADLASFKRFQLHMGQRKTVRRTRARRSHVAERATDRSREELSRHGEQLSRGRWRRLYGLEGRNRAAIRHL